MFYNDKFLIFIQIFIKNCLLQLRKSTNAYHLRAFMKISMIDILMGT